MALFPILMVAFFIYLGYKACKKRSEHTYRCPKCGTINNASPWSTGLKHRGGGYVHSYKCKHCGHEYYD